VRACLQGSERKKERERERERKGEREREKERKKERERERERKKERKKEREREGEKEKEGGRESVCIGVLNFSFYACIGAHTLFTDQRKGERERKKRKGITGALAPFSYLVL
jgi:hypothetical protein